MASINFFIIFFSTTRLLKSYCAEYLIIRINIKIAREMNIYQARTLWLISIFLILRLIFLYLSPLGLHGDEAQYWVWSKNLDWGYYSKPPFVALIIFYHNEYIWGYRMGGPSFFTLITLFNCIFNI